MPQQRLACIIIARNLGDAVIQSSAVRQLAARGYARQYLIWTRPQVAFLFVDIPGCTVIASQFPVGTTKQFGWKAAVEFVRACRTIRRMKPSVSLDFIGDQRERWFAKLAGSPQHCHIGWAAGHDFARLIRNPFGTGGPAYVVPCETANVYAAYQQFIDYLTPTAGPQPAKVQRDGNAPARIGMHPFASHAWKRWPAERWQQLAAQLLQRGCQLTAYGAPAERAELQAIFGPHALNMRLVTGSLPSFADDLKTLDLLIGLDSFSVHMAHRQGVRSIMLNAGNPPTLWGPPDGVVLADSGGCTTYPCYNKPQCQGTAHEYACVKSVAVDDVTRVHHD